MSDPTQTTPEVIQDTTPTPTTTPQSIDPGILSAYNNVIAEKDRQVREALQQLEAMRAQVNAPPSVSREESSKQFFEDPVSLLRTEIQRAIAPINQTINEFRAESTFSKMKSQMKMDPRFKDLDKIEREFDAMMQNQNPDVNTMTAAYYAAYGMVASSQPNRLFAAPAATPTTPTNTPPVITPPHMRPSNPPAPVAPKTPATGKRELTENERLLMRINGIKTEEEWWSLMDANPETFVAKKPEGQQ